MRSLKQLLLIAVLVTVFSWTFWYLFFNGKRDVNQKAANIQALVLEAQDCPEVPSQIMSELCGLSSDAQLTAPWDLYLARLRAFPGTKACSGSHHEAIGYIQYTMRTPLFSLGGYDNVVLDEEGIGFPLVPLFSPMKLPILFTSKVSSDSFPRVDLMEVTLAQELQTLIRQSLSKTTLEIDLRVWNHPSPYRREIIVLVEGGMYIRLPVVSYEKRLLKLSELLQKHEIPLSYVDCRFANHFLIKEFAQKTSL